MKERTKYHTGKGGRENIPYNPAGLPEDGLLLSHSDRALLDQAASFIMAACDIEEVKNDPGYDTAMLTAGEMIRDYKNKPSWSRENAKFVVESFEKAQNEILLEKEIMEIEREAHDEGVFRTAAEWVAERDKSINGREIKDHADRERREFISRALKDELSEPAEVYEPVKNRGISFRIPGYISVPAAAAVLALVTLQFLASPGTPGEIYNKFYEPAAMVSPVTRGNANDFTANYSAGIEKYRSGDYAGAARHFELAMRADRNAVAPRYYYGITSLALGDYRTAADYLDDLAGSASGYGKEAQWYLGMSYLKAGEKEKAVSCFESLASTPGYYRDRAMKLLRRLK